MKSVIWSFKVPKFCIFAGKILKYVTLLTILIGCLGNMHTIECICLKCCQAFPSYKVQTEESLMYKEIVKCVFIRFIIKVVHVVRCRQIILLCLILGLFYLPKSENKTPSLYDFRFSILYDLL